MCCLFIVYEGMCDVFHRLLGDVCSLFIVYEGMCGAFSSFARGRVVPFHRL